MDLSKKPLNQERVNFLHELNIVDKNNKTIKIRKRFVDLSGETEDSRKLLNELKKYFTEDEINFYGKDILKIYFKDIDFDIIKLNCENPNCKSKNSYKQLIGMKLYELCEDCRSTLSKEEQRKIINQACKKDRALAIVMKKYGVRSTAQLQSVKEKQKKTNLERYGGVSPTCNEEIRQKQIQTSIEKYGVKNYTQTEEFKKYISEHHKIKMNEPEVQEKIRKTMLEKYGVSRYAKSYEFKFFMKENKERFQEKVKETSLSKYGALYYTQSNEYKKRIPDLIEKAKETSMKKYGTPYYTQTDEFKNFIQENKKKFVLKAKETSMKKYGVENYMYTEEFRKRIPEFQKKTRETSMKKYGAPYYTQSYEFKSKQQFFIEKAKETSIKKYGAPHYTQSYEFKLFMNKHQIEFQEKAQETSIKKYGVPYYAQSHEHKQPQISKDEYLERQKNLNSQYIHDNFIDKNTNHFKIKEFCEYFVCSETTAYKFMKNHEIKYTKMKGYSRLEKEVLEYVELIMNNSSNNQGQSMKELGKIEKLKLEIQDVISDIKINFLNYKYKEVYLNKNNNIKKFKTSHNEYQNTIYYIKSKKNELIQSIIDIFIKYEIYHGVYIKQVFELNKINLQDFMLMIFKSNDNTFCEYHNCLSLKFIDENKAGKTIKKLCKRHSTPEFRNIHRSYKLSDRDISEETIRKRKETSLKKYGVDNPMKDPDIQNKVRKTKRIENLDDELINQYDERYQNYNKEFIEREFIDENKHFGIKNFCDYFMCSTTFAYKTLKNFDIEYIKYKNTSRLEKEVLSYIEYFEKTRIIENSKGIITPLELDIYVPDKKLAIEFDGLYWHSLGKEDIKENFNLNFYKYKHLQKTEACESNNINLLHIFENEWVDPRMQDIWKSVIAYKLNKTDKKYFARKLEIKEIKDKVLVKKFFDENHLQGGNSPSKIAIGAFDKKTQELVSCMTFAKSRYSKNHQYELIRFASKKYTACVGCAQRLFKYFIKNYKPESVVSYANRRWASSLSNLYQSIGFNYLRTADPNYFYFKIDGENPVLYSRVQFQKHKLKDHPETKDFYDPSKSELEIMMDAGFRRIYDAGNLVYEWRA